MPENPAFSSKWAGPVDALDLTWLPSREEITHARPADQVPGGLGRFPHRRWLVAAVVLVVAAGLFFLLWQPGSSARGQKTVVTEGRCRHPGGGEGNGARGRSGGEAGGIRDERGGTGGGGYREGGRTAAGCRHSHYQPGGEVPGWPEGLRSPRGGGRERRTAGRGGSEG